MCIKHAGNRDNSWYIFMNVFQNNHLVNANEKNEKLCLFSKDPFRSYRLLAFFAQLFFNRVYTSGLLRTMILRARFNYTCADLVLKTIARNTANTNHREPNLDKRKR
jgi:hypothetical protein